MAVGEILEVFCKNTIDGEIMAGCWGQGRDITYLHWMIEAWGWTVGVSLVALVIALVVGSVIGVIRTLPNSPWAARFGIAWVELFRNIPLLVQVFLWYFVLPKIIPPMRSLPPFVLIVCALGFFTSARIAEQVRSGVETLPRGQRYAAMAVGFTTFQSYRYTILPMAYRIVFPTLISEAMNIFKNSAVAFAVSIPVLSQYFLQASEETGAVITMFIAVTLLYILSAMTMNRLLVSFEKRLQLPGFVASGGTGGH